MWCKIFSRCFKTKNRVNYNPTPGLVSKPSLSRKELKQQVIDMPNDSELKQAFVNAKNFCLEKRFSEAQKIAENFFSNGYIIEAIKIYQQIISTDPSYNCDIEGLGSPFLSEGYYDWNVFEWYNKQKMDKSIKSSHYDALSLWFMLLTDKQIYLDELKMGQMWYQQMVSKQPENIGLTMGYANLFACKKSSQEALKLYDKVITIKFDLINVYTSRAMLYMYTKNKPEQIKERAFKIKEFSPSNIYADFILACDIYDIDEKISQLKKLSTKYPEYVRIMEQIGQSFYHSNRKSDKEYAIEWFKNCIEIQPLYFSPYKNIIDIYYWKKDYQQARKWIYKAIQIRPYYSLLYNKILNTYLELDWTDEKIEEEVLRQNNINFPIFCWMLGLQFQEKQTPQTQRVIKWQENSVKLCPQKFYFCYKLGNYLWKNGQFQRAIPMYQLSISLNPKLQEVYLKVAFAYSKLNQLQKAEEYYKIIVQMNQEPQQGWYNLGQLYMNNEMYEEAIKFNQLAIQCNSTFTLALVNLEYCYYKVNKYKEAMQTISRAMQALPYDNKLTLKKKQQLKEQLNMHQRGVEKRQNIAEWNKQQQNHINQLRQGFVYKFKNKIVSRKDKELPKQKILKPEILSILKILKQDKFQLLNIQEIFQLVQRVFHLDEDYFHIIPLLLIKKFTISVFEQNKNILKVEGQLKDLMNKIYAKVTQKQFAQGQNKKLMKKYEIKLTQSQITKEKVNLFKTTIYFKSTQKLYNQVIKVNEEAKKSYDAFNSLVQETRKKSNGIQGGISTKIPNEESEKFKVLLRIMQKMFENELNDEKKTQIIELVWKNIKDIENNQPDEVVKKIMKVWNYEIKLILVQRYRLKINTEFAISDLLRAKCLYNSIDDLIEAVRVVDSYCKTFNFKVIEPKNRLDKPQTQDVAFKIKINDAVCQFQLAINQNQTYTHLDHCVYEILRSPLGVIFGSYLFMSKKVKYPFLTNCKDIVKELQDSQDQEMKLIKECAQYVLDALQKVK